MAEFLKEMSLFPLVLTFGTYQLGLWCRKKWNSPLFNPILISALLSIGVLLLTGYPNESYQVNMQSVSWLLTPATVCLALPLYNQLNILKKQLPAILIGIVAGTVASLLFVLGMCRLFLLDHSLTVSLLPKSVTTAIGMVLSEENGGIGALTAPVIIITGVLGSLLGARLCKILKITDPFAQGVALGTSAHVIGTSYAYEQGELQGAVSSLSLVVAGVLTALVFPLVLLLV